MILPISIPIQLSFQKPDPRYLFTQALANFDGHDYFAWYYDYNNMLRWSQTVASTGGNENLMTTMSNSGKMGSQVYNVMNQVNELTYIVNTTLEGEEQAKYTYLKALCQPLMIYLAMWDTDMYGSMAYTEAYQARYGGTLTPKYDTQAELFDLWEKQLKETVETLANDVTIDGNKSNTAVFRLTGYHLPRRLYQMVEICQLSPFKASSSFN
ncbi:SusD/RagB family nutrient-binding outer membrane lipoprotein [Phocaeicola dorei]|nr:SusD/RagB family nutrient-binding outer membrane lipoprotein [Phocaeicola dorei]